MTQKAQKLEHCPFCGGAGMMQYTPASWGYYSAKYKVKCIKCGSTGPTVEDKETKAHKPEKEAATAWNNRVPLEEAKP